VSQSTHRSDDETTSNMTSKQSSSKASEECDITTDTVVNATDAEENTKEGIVQREEPLKVGDGGNDNGDFVEADNKNASLVAGMAEESQRNDATVDPAAESTSAGIFSNPTNVATKASVVESQLAAGKSDQKSLDTAEPRQNKDALRFLKKTKFAIKMKKTDKPSIWSHKMTSRSEQQDFSQLEEDMRKEKPKFNLKGDKLLLKAITSLKKNLSQEKAEEGPNPEPLPPKLLDAVNNFDPAE
jgi:hypothetical protein